LIAACASDRIDKLATSFFLRKKKEAKKNGHRRSFHNRDIHMRTLADKLKTLDALQATVAQLKADGKRVVWTNGCFDILHAGHVTYLQQAARLGDVLIIGLNSDASVQANKGPGRPIVNENDRALLISALECVDLLTIIQDRTMARILGLLEPDVFAKGGDYTLDTLDQEERRVVEAYGGTIALIPMVQGKSTTALVNKILNS